MSFAFLFSGQGAQAPGMMSDLYDSYDICREVFNNADKILNRSITDICFSGSAEQLNLTENTQPCVLTVEIAILQILKHYGIKPDFIAGFSLGEWSGLVASEVLTFSQVLQLVSTRARAMQNAVPIGKGSMVAILGKNTSQVNSYCRGIDDVYACNFNCPGQIVIGGLKDAVVMATKIAEADGAKAIPLAVSIPSHCPLMQPASIVLEQELSVVDLCKPRVPIIMNVDGLPHTDVQSIKQNLIQQLVQPVQFEKSIEKMLDMGVDHFIEIGPGRTLSGFVKKINKSVLVSRVENLKTLQDLLQTLAIEL